MTKNGERYMRENDRCLNDRSRFHCILLGTTDHRERTFSVEVVKHLVFMRTDGSDVIEAVPVEGYRGKSML